MTICVCVLIFLLPLMIVHILFKGVAENQWFEATWKAGELLAYIAGFETLLGTVILGMITVYQSDRANEINERLNKENNYLQRISIQQMLPVLKIMDIIVLNTVETHGEHLGKNAIVEVSSIYTPDKREPHIRVYLPRQNNNYHFHKVIKFSLKNISSGPISQISIDKIEFSGFKYKGSQMSKASCAGMDKAKYISWLILPGDKLGVIVDIYFDNKLYKEFWEFDDFTSIGCFDMCLYITNTSLSGIEYKEKIYIEKCAGFKEKIMYKAYGEE